VSFNELEAFEGNYMVVWVRICDRKGWKSMLVCFAAQNRLEKVEN
jgi:hypothetical protein